MGDEGSVAGGTPKLILTDTSGDLLKVDVLAYPEDTFLVVDPYAEMDEPQVDMDDLIAKAEATLPRPLGEIIAARPKNLRATRLFRMVLLDFKQRRYCRAKIVEETLRQLICQVTSLQVRRLGLDRFDLLEPCISAFRVLHCLTQQMMSLKAAGISPPETLIFSLSQPSVFRRYQLALENLP